jgi:hypothetical protein
LERGEAENPKLSHLVNCSIALGLELANVLEDEWLEWLSLQKIAASPPNPDAFWRRPYRPST